jgi:hypothetical protein
MKLPTLNRPSRADPNKKYLVIQGFSGDPLPGFEGFSPKIGDRFRGDHPVVKFLFEQGAGSRLFIEDGATTDELHAATAEATFGALGGPAYADRPVPQTPEPALMVCVQALQIGEQGVIAVGTLADAGSQWVARYPANWQPAPEGYSS